MKLGDYLDKDLILSDMASADKAGALGELVVPLQERFPEMDSDLVLRVLKEREELGTTGIGDGVAIPHGKLDSLDQIAVVAGRSRDGLDFEALDFKPCHIFFLVLAPEQVAGMHLRILAHISRLLKDDSFRKAFMEAEGQDELWKLLKSA
ncbi:PTS sugar transporter subunit IIA [Desulfovibrio oxyclinae]|jgi:PTS system nitrogen regulatory IIA component|uniref:PTS sugar transporter subunit IIA n=1 Tax=Desulfovibrio oxyclinae TaxID=63560 RepID=UPI0003659AD9|nr:PTS sugar transporter subunit IIA [Desulfovibrio oxyclinae]